MRYLLSDIAQIVGGDLRGEDREVLGVVCDSRGSIGSHSLFVAICGENHDSHNYILQMMDRGVDSFLVEREGDYLDDTRGSYVVVDSSIGALQLLAAHHRSLFRGEVIAITGSNGKTTIKEWVAQLAPLAVKIFRSPRSYNSQLGVALSLLMIEGDEDFAIIEAGISRPSEMERLERMIRPDMVVVSSIGEAHSEGFNSLEHKIEEKMMLARGAKRVIYNSRYSELIPHVIYGEWLTIDASKFEALDMSDEATRCNSQIVVALFHTLGFDTPSFEAITPMAMRLEMVEGLSDSIIINDSYSSDLSSLTIALDALRSYAGDRPTTVILSDILQSGVSRAELYQRVSEAVERAGIDRVIGVGREICTSRRLFKAGSRFYLSTEELLAKLSMEDYASRAILLKGSRTSRFETIAYRLARKSHTTTLEVNLNTLASNLNYYRSMMSPKTKVVAMVKAQAYGAGAQEVARALANQGVNYLAVAFADEGSELRESGVTLPIIVLNADDGSFSQMVDSRLEPEIYSLRSLRNFASAVVARGERGYPIHIKLDSGMHRLGFRQHDIEQLSEELSLLGDAVRVASIFSHLATADMEDVDAKYKCRSQISLFDEMSREIEERIGYTTIRHIANSAAIVHYPEAHFDMCRVGIGLYGFGDCDDVVEPISTLCSRIVQIHQLEEGERIGYGMSEPLSRLSRIATIPVGYADGVDRRLGNGAWSLIVRGESAPIIGRVSMDSLMIDVTDIDGVEEGDLVTILSSKSGNSAADMADRLGTISYEVLTSISERVKRIYIKD